MIEFQASLIREKIVFDDQKIDIPDAVSSGATGQKSVRSNRIALRLFRGSEEETVVIRAQNTHSTLRMAAKVFLNFYKGGGPFLKRNQMPNWEKMWMQSLSSYEERFNGDQAWCALYLKGKAVYKTKNDRFMDIIEQCALASKGNYDSTKDVVEYVLKQLGRNISVTHYNKVASVIKDDLNGLKCSIMQRSEANDAVFSFKMLGGEVRADRIHHAFIMAASFLEAINLEHVVQHHQKLLSSKKITKDSDAVLYMRESQKRQVMLSREISAIEGLYDINYWPDKPDFFVT